MVEIVQNGNPVLRKKAEEVPVASIESPKIKKIIKDMTSALYSQNDGVAIAAPQIAESVRIFVVASKVFDEDFARGKKIDIKEKTKNKQIHSDMVFINPVFKKISKDKKLMAEGCLSVRPLYGKVRRATKATVEAYDEHGKKFTKSATGLLAHIFQHEIDHLDGILFIDKARDIHESTPEKEYN
jgi:peptide deformylase